MKSLWMSDVHGLERFETVQNNFSLINRRCEANWLRCCVAKAYRCYLYSPLGGGVLTGKYENGPPPGGRFTDYLLNGADRQKRMAQRFVNERTIETTRRFKIDR